MTEAEWLASEDWHPMLRFLDRMVAAGNEKPPAARWESLLRKENLFSAACCRLLWDWLTDGFRGAVLDIERHADDPGQPDANGVELEHEFELSRRAAPEPVQSAFDALHATWRFDDVTFGNAAVRKEQTPLARDIFGNPFRPAVVDPAWLLWNESGVRKLAQSVYAERAFDRLPVLADALEDAGCADADLLSHCRSGGPHVRGCWVVDALLGKR
jgi:hypothetical protein